MIDGDVSDPSLAPGPLSAGRVAAAADLKLIRYAFPRLHINDEQSVDIFVQCRHCLGVFHQLCATLFEIFGLLTFNSFFSIEIHVLL